MLNNLKQRKAEGFTIIEVMIVLAIAGLIMLIVFLAVPALQRNSRNTSIKNDAAAVSAAIGEFQSNNSGAMPTSVTASAGTVTASSTVSGSVSATGKVQGATTVTVVTTAPAATGGTAGAISVQFGKTCDGGSSTRAAAVFYYVENSGTTTARQCVDN
jgi:prepilin-type N-terminal cleavage/methylation domain-containing protein